MFNIEKPLDIGIYRLTVVSEMAKLLSSTKNKEDALQILEAIAKELKEGIREIDRIIKEAEKK